MKTTSLEAYSNVKQRIPNDHKEILSVLSRKEPLTYKEIGFKIYKKLILKLETKQKAFAWKYDPNKVSRRMAELVRDGKVKVSGIRKCRLAKSNCTTYILL